MMEPRILPIHVKPYIQYTKNGGKLSILVSPRVTGGHALENVVISLTLPSFVSSAKIDGSIGNVNFDQLSKVY